MPMKTLNKFYAVALAAFFGLTLAAFAEDDDDDKEMKPAAPAISATNLPPVSTKTNVLYATDIKPILDSSCADCHSGNRAKGQLHLDTLDGVLKGGKEGKILTVGDSTNSLIVLSVAHLTRDNEDWMPPVRNREGIKPLQPSEIGLIRAWIEQGAK